MVNPQRHRERPPPGLVHGALALALLSGERGVESAPLPGLRAAEGLSLSLGELFSEDRSVQAETHALSGARSLVSSL